LKNAAELGYCIYGIMGHSPHGKSLPLAQSVPKNIQIRAVIPHLLRQAGIDDHHSQLITGSSWIFPVQVRIVALHDNQF